MSNVDICHISVTLNITFNNVKDFKDTRNCQNWKFQEVWVKCRSEICFLRQPFTKYLETSLQKPVN